MKKHVLLVLLCSLLLVLPVIACAAGTVTVNGTAYSTLEAALAANKNTTGTVIMTINGNVEWTTGAGHGSTAFDEEGGFKIGQLKIVGADKNATFTAVGSGVGPVGANDFPVVFENLRFVDKSVSYAENSWEFGYLEFRGDLTFNNCVFDKSSITVSETEAGAKCKPKARFNDCSFSSAKDSEYAVWVSNGEAIFNDCVFSGARGVKMHEAYGSAVDTVGIHGCIFNDLTKKPALAIGDVDQNTVVTIKDTKVNNCKAGDQNAYLYESDTDLSKFTFKNANNVICNEHNLVKKSYNGVEYYECDVCHVKYEDKNGSAIADLKTAVDNVNMPSTGDESMLLLWMSLLLLSGCAFIGYKKIGQN